MRLLWGAWLASSTFATTLVQRQNDVGDYKVVDGTLQTPWTDSVGTNPWPEYPRPRLQRSQWKNLNGLWRYRNATEGDISTPPFGQHLEQTVLVPFCLESALSGTMFAQSENAIGSSDCRNKWKMAHILLVPKVLRDSS